MIAKFEKNIRNSGFEATWAIYFIVFQIIVSFILVSLVKIFGNSNFINTNQFADSYIKIVFGIFFLIFTILIIREKGSWEIPKSYLTFGFFLIVPLSFISRIESVTIPKKYENWDSFIIEEY